MQAAVFAADIGGAVNVATSLCFRHYTPETPVALLPWRNTRGNIDGAAAKVPVL